MSGAAPVSDEESGSLSRSLQACLLLESALRYALAGHGSFCLRPAHPACVPVLVSGENVKHADHRRA